MAVLDTTLEYPSILHENNITNILLIDNTVPNYQLFVNSVNSNTFPIVYSYNSSKNELLNLLKTNFTNLARIAIVFHSDGPMPKMFLDNKPLFLDNEVLPYSENVEFVINIIKQFQVKNIDYLACNTLNFSNWVSYYDILKNETNVIVGASKDETGNINYGGDWVMESTSEDIELVYFTQSIEYYTYLLGGNLSITTIVIKKDNTIYVTGNNSAGQLGLGNTTTPITSLTLMTNVPARKTPVYISCGAFFTIVLMSDYTIYGTGSNADGQLGIGNNTITSVTSLRLMSSVPAGKTPAVISCGGYFTIVLMTDGTIYGTGANNNGQLGIGNTTLRTSLTLMNSVPAGKRPIAISCGGSFTILLMSDGTIYGTGSNNNGQLGLGDTTTPITRLTLMSSVPVGKTPVSISCGSEYTIVLMTDGTIYVTGANTNGQLGLGDTTRRTSLTLMSSVPAGKTPASICCGTDITIVLMTDFTIYGTGANNNGQLGLGNTTRRTSLTLMSSVPAGKTPAAISCGANFTIVLMTDGTIYGTGTNSNGQLSLGDTTLRTSLTLMSETNIKKLMDTSYYNFPCFKEDSKILTNKGYIPIQHLRKGDLVKTLLHEYKPIDTIGKRVIYHPSSKERIKDQLYKCCQEQYPELFEDLVITGCHSILVDDFINEEQKNKAIEINNGHLCVTDNKYRLPSCLDDRTTVYETPGNYTIYHLALENDNYYFNYGIYANGLLVETCSKRYLKELSNMELIE